MPPYSLGSNEEEKLFGYTNQIRFFPSSDLPENEGAHFLGNVSALQLKMMENIQSFTHGTSGLYRLQ
jgi:hypothetical protein